MKKPTKKSPKKREKEYWGKEDFDWDNFVSDVRKIIRDSGLYYKPKKKRGSK